MKYLFRVSLLLLLVESVICFVTVPSARRMISVVHVLSHEVDAQTKTPKASDELAEQFAHLLERSTPADMFSEDNDSEDDVMNEVLDASTQIFDPFSFWTERTGRFPRNK